MAELKWYQKLWDAIRWSTMCFFGKHHIQNIELRDAWGDELNVCGCIFCGRMFLGHFVNTDTKE